MIAISWKSQLPFREIKEKVAERKKAAPENAENKWNYLRFWRFLVIHYLGPVVIEEESHGLPMLAMHHCLMIGFCFSRSGKTRMLGFSFFDYIFEALFFTITFLGPLLINGSWIQAILTSLPFMVLYSFITRRETKILLHYDRLFLGFDPE